MAARIAKKELATNPRLKKMMSGEENNKET